MGRVFAAIDLGASGGRVMVGVVDRNSITLHNVHRFDNGVHEREGHLHWNLTGLYAQVLVGLEQVGREYPTVESIGIDTWGVDYGLLDADGDLIAEPIAYRDSRTDAVVEEVHALVDPAELYRINGLQHLPFNTIYQLAAEHRSGRLADAAAVVLLPDLLAYWLTGVLRSEYTNASTTGLVDATAREWSAVLLGRLGINLALFPRLEQAGSRRGRVRPELCAQLGLPNGIAVTTVASHDTASAVAAVPAIDPNFAYIASGTWSLVGLELPGPVLSDDARAANFTNEAGLDGRIRFLRNVGGLWLLQESMRHWHERGRPQELAALTQRAARLPAGGPIVEVDDPLFIPPGDMPSRILAAAGRELTDAPERIVRCILDSLATGYARTLDTAARLTCHAIDVVHLVGGGSQNALLCELTATAAARTVIGGPAEATAIGNIATQARAAGALPDDLDRVRGLLASSLELRTFHPATVTR